MIVLMCPVGKKLQAIRKSDPIYNKRYFNENWTEGRAQYT